MANFVGEDAVGGAMRIARIAGEFRVLGNTIRVTASVLLALVAQNGWCEDALPPGFVHLRDVAPSIRQDIRYAGAFNFTGKIVPGYARAECIARAAVAKALARAQARLEADGFALRA